MRTNFKNENISMRRDFVNSKSLDKYNLTRSLFTEELIKIYSEKK